MSFHQHKLPILLYHRIVRKSDAIGKHKIYVFEQQFEKQLAYLKENNFSTITFKDLLNAKPDEDFSKKIILTFDDGYEDNYTLLFPLLKKYGFTAVIYLVTKLHRNEWGIAEGEPACNLMTAAQINEMSDYGIEFGGHTCTHKALNEISIEHAKTEIEDCNIDVKKILGKDVHSFAYPFGGINKGVKTLMENSGVPFAVSTNTGPLNWYDDKMQIRRIEVRPGESLGSFINKASGYYLTKTSIYTLFSSSNKIKY
jgi:peptidoglycan/xylan/chitin deacetylase (PgdA/CDA1 family)